MIACDVDHFGECSAGSVRRSAITIPSAMSSGLRPSPTPPARRRADTSSVSDHPSSLKHGTAQDRADDRSKRRVEFPWLDHPLFSVVPPSSTAQVSASRRRSGETLTTIRRGADKLPRPCGAKYHRRIRRRDVCSLPDRPALRSRHRSGRDDAARRPPTALPIRQPNTANPIAPRPLDRRQPFEEFTVKRHGDSQVVS